MHSKFLTSVMVLGVVNNERHVMTPHLLTQGRRANAIAYVETLHTVIESTIVEVAGGESVLARRCHAHRIGKTKEWLAESYCPSIWPPIPSDLNPTDYYVSGVVERETNKYAYNTKDSLNATIYRVGVHYQHE